MKTITIDADVAYELKKEKNASLLINNFLRNYFSLGSKLEQNLEKAKETAEQKKNESLAAEEILTKIEQEVEKAEEKINNDWVDENEI